MTKHSVKPKYIDALVKLWTKQGLSPGTMKNQMSNLRWWARAVNKANVIGRSNGFYGIEDRQYGSSGTSKARTREQDRLEMIKDHQIRMSLQLQAAFGLRREEALKIRPRQAGEGGQLRLQASRTKGGKERVVPVREEEQRKCSNRPRSWRVMGH